MNPDSASISTKHRLSLSADHAAYHHLGAAIDINPPNTILLLHGFLGESDCWLPLMQALPTDFCSISLDLLGFGDSSKPPIRYDIAQEVAFVRQFVTKLGLTHMTIVGHSFGGWVAAAYAIAYPAQVDRLILVAPAGIRDDEFCDRYNHLRPLLWPSPVIDRGLALLRPFARLINRQSGFDTIRQFRRELQRQPAAKSFLVDRLRPEDAIDTVEDQIHQITAPTTVVAGAEDDTIPLWHCQTYADRIPLATLVTLPAVQHNIPQTQTHRLASILKSCLNHLDQENLSCDR
jgi:pimeloyl-ACP methyl ester carboxylesterase